MIFIGIAILIVAAITLMINADAGTPVGLSQEQTARLVPLVVILIVIAAGAFSRRRKFSELFGGVLLWAGIFGVAMLTYAYRDELTSMAGRVAGNCDRAWRWWMPSAARRHSGAALAGISEIAATINGHRTPMIFDTGASAVVLTLADAREAGIDTANLRFTIPVSTANGMGRAARVKLDQLEVGGIVRKGVVAFVTEEAALETSLLGMTFLETLSRYSVTQNSLELID
ncbi:TIGR02281 family clan AA aspartic protease [Devosia sp. A8/3-2]|nr:TIGR02281 family clan AA aspartic protease [Devosia sp. A8/3-2]